MPGGIEIILVFLAGIVTGIGFVKIFRFTITTFDIFYHYPILTMAVLVVELFVIWQALVNIPQLAILAQPAWFVGFIGTIYLITWNYIERKFGMI